MKIEINTPQTFEIPLKQLEDLLSGSGWTKQPHNDNTNKFQNQKHTNLWVILPKIEGALLDEQRLVLRALRIIADVNNNCGVETIINRVLGDG